MNQIKKPRVRRLSLKSHKINKIEIVALVSLVVLVGAAVVYKSFAGSNAKYVPVGVGNMSGMGRAIRVNPTATGGYVMNGKGVISAFKIGTTTGRAPYALPTSYSSQADTARDFEVLDWNNPSVLLLTKDAQLHIVGNPHEVQVEPVTTSTARKLIMYDAKRGYIFDGSGRFTRFALDGAALPPVVGGLTVRAGQDFYRSAKLNPRFRQNGAVVEANSYGYVAGADGNVYEFKVGNNPIAPAVSAGTTWAGSDKAIDIVLTDWSSRQGYVIASDGGWYAFNGAPNDYNKKSGAPFNFGTSVRGFHMVAGKSGFELSKDGVVYVFSLPNYLVAQNNKEIYPPPAKKPFKPDGPIVRNGVNTGYYRMPTAPNGEYDFYNFNVPPFNTVTDSPDKTGTSLVDRCGSLSLVNTVYKVSTQWQAAYGKEGSRITVSDLNAAGHASHDRGVDVDIRVSNLSAANVKNANKGAPTDAAYRARSIQLATWFIDDGAKLIFYNDPVVIDAVNRYGRSKGLNYDVMQSLAGHHDHFHVRIGARTAQTNNPLALNPADGCP